MVKALAFCTQLETIHSHENSVCLLKKGYGLFIYVNIEFVNSVLLKQEGSVCPQMWNGLHDCNDVEIVRSRVASH